MNQSMNPGVRPYVFEIMNYLVAIHAQVCSVAEGLLDRTLNALLDEFVKEVIRCFGQVKRFGTGGLLTVRIWRLARPGKIMITFEGRHGIDLHPKISRLLWKRHSSRDEARGSIHTTDHSSVFSFVYGGNGL